jgi:hypothetical protein
MFVTTGVSIFTQPDHPAQRRSIAALAHQQSRQLIAGGARRISAE